MCAHDVLWKKMSIDAALRAVPHRKRPRLSAEVELRGPGTSEAQPGQVVHAELDGELDAMIEVEHNFPTDSSVGFPEWAAR